MILRQKLSSILMACTVSIALGCTRSPGHTLSTGEAERPDQVLDFAALYNRNCAGCHGADGKQGASIPLSDPVYQAVVDDGTLRDVIANGRPGSHMPPFAESAGGLLSDRQIDALVSGMRQHWFEADALGEQKPPPYRDGNAGDPKRGSQVYTFYCASCHGAIGQKPGKNGSIVDPSFLQLIDDQSLRTLVIVGRPDLGMPNWRNRVPGHPMSAKEVTDVVSWLSSQRPQMPSAEKSTSRKEGGS